MENHEYERTQQMILMVGQSVLDLDLKTFLVKINHAQAIAPLVNPTLFIEAASNLQDIKGLAERLKHFQDLTKEITSR